MSGIIQYNLVDKVFGEWTVLKRSDKSKRTVYWTCLCTCGTIRDIPTQNLRDGRSTNCGCKRLKHGNSRRSGKTPEYHVWKRMRQRCFNKLSADYKYYGARGITVSEEWREFAAFIRDMGPMPSPAHSIERIDNDKSYCKANCKWGTRLEQQNNTRRNRRITYQNETMTLSQWAAKLGMSPKVLSARLNAYKWSVHDAFNLRVKSRNSAS